MHPTSLNKDGYRIIGWLGNDPSSKTLGVSSEKYGFQLWGHGRVTYKKKYTSCVICGNPLGSFAYRPMTNGGNRMERMCARHDPAPEQPHDPS